MDKASEESHLRRISLMVREDHYRALVDRGLNVSGLIRDLMDDYLSQHNITVSVGEETRSLYDQVVANTGSTDEDVEVYFREALKHLLRDKIKSMQKLEKKIR